jgi:hypothetical protein
MREVKIGKIDDVYIYNVQSRKPNTLEKSMAAGSEGNE